MKAYAPQGVSNSALVTGVLYENSTDVKVALFFTAEVLSEEPILKWYKDAHVAKGKSVFLEQMKKFVEWLKNAEEESESEAEEGD